MHILIKRPAKYNYARHYRLVWVEKLVYPKPLTRYFNRLYGRRDVALDCGYIKGDKI